MQDCSGFSRTNQHPQLLNFFSATKKMYLLKHRTLLSPPLKYLNQFINLNLDIEILKQTILFRHEINIRTKMKFTSEGWIIYVCIQRFSIKFSLLFFQIHNHQLTAHICKQQTRLLMNNLQHKTFIYRILNGNYKPTQYFSIMFHPPAVIPVSPFSHNRYKVILHSTKKKSSLNMHLVRNYGVVWQ